MKERLVIKNFGPIKSVDLDLGKMTILIGDNATGKSTIVKVLAVCRFFSYINDYNHTKSRIDSFKIGLLTFGILEYFNEKTIINYENKDYKIEVFYGVKETKLDENGNEIKLVQDCTSIVTIKSEEYKSLLEILEKSKPWYNYEYSFDEKFDNYFKKISDWQNWYPSDNFFQFDVKKVMNNPLFLPIERSLQGISFNEDLLLSNATQTQLRKLNRIFQYSGNLELPLESLKLVFKRENNINYIKKEGIENFHTLSNSASGYQSITPIFLSVKYYNEFKQKSKTFIIEEPENNLFPKVQKKLVEFFAESMNQFNHQFLLPTHSPYILSSLNNLMYAYKIANEFQTESEVEKIISKDFWVNPEDVEVYYLENGIAKSLIDKKLGLINIDELDGVSEIINKEFDELLSIEIKYSEDDKV